MPQDPSGALTVKSSTNIWFQPLMSPIGAETPEGLVEVLVGVLVAVAALVAVLVTVAEAVRVGLAEVVVAAAFALVVAAAVAAAVVAAAVLTLAVGVDEAAAAVARGFGWVLLAASAECSGIASTPSVMARTPAVGRVILLYVRILIYSCSSSCPGEIATRLAVHEPINHLMI